MNGDVGTSLIIPAAEQDIFLPAAGLLRRKVEREKIMFRFVRTATATTLLLALAAPAMGEVSYPRTIGSGENVEIDYGPNGPGNLLGGGRVIVTGSGEDTQLRHLDPEFVQAPRAGLVPVTVGSGEGSATVWVPAGTDRSRLALIGADGSLPAESGAGSNFLARVLAKLRGEG